MKIVIHSCKKRAWYVEQFLKPSLLEQSTREEEIVEVRDLDGKGNMASFLESMELVSRDFEPTTSAWHIQDDVLLCRDFVTRAKEIEKNWGGVACGFCCKLNEAGRFNYTGAAPAQQMWWSFPCILIPNSYCGEFLDWYHEFIHRAPAQFKATAAMDDYFFREFMMRCHHREKVLNVVPNLVEHVDWLIGGSTISKRDVKYRSGYWQDQELVSELRRRL